MKIALIAAIAGAAIGLACGIVFFGSTDEDRTDDSSSPVRGQGAPAEQGSRLPEEEVEGEGGERHQIPESGNETRDDPKLFSKALLSYFRSEYVRAWSEKTDVQLGEGKIARGEQRFRRAVLDLPAELAVRDAGQQLDRAAVEQAVDLADGCVLLDLAGEGYYEPEFGDQTRKTIDRCVKRRSSGSTVEGAKFFANKDAKVTEGMTITFGAGIYKLDERRLRGEDGRTFPVDVTISGAGIDATLLRLGDISIRGDMERFALRNLTIDAENDGLFDLRSGSLLVDLLNVRIVCFDAGHGGCSIFGVRKGSMIKATNCQIIGGYGRAPGNGRLFSGSPVIADFVNCRLELLDLTLKDVSLTGRVLFQNCVFALMKKDPQEDHPSSVRFAGCLVESLLDRTDPDLDLQKDLGDLFWQLRNQ